ncbi:hypothetical protein H1R20_g1125, partial [Candolleomyces eurysporus]
MQAKSDSPTEDAAVAVPALESIDISASLPTLTSKNEKGEDIRITDLANEQGVVLFLVLKADTPFDAHTPLSVVAYIFQKELPYPLISDPKRVLVAALGAAEGGKTKRSHFVFAKGRKLVDKKIPVKPVDSPRLALEFIKSIQEVGDAPAS